MTGGSGESAESHGFVHLRLHTAFSLLEGALLIRDLAHLCERHGMPALAITDTNNLFGALEFSDTLSKAGVQPVVGCTLSVDFEELLGEEELPSQRSVGAKRIDRGDATEGSIALFAQNEDGYKNLMALSGQAYRNGKVSGRTAVTLSDLTHRTDGIIALTGGRLGLLDRLILDDAKDAALNVLKALMELFPQRLYVELQRHKDEIAPRTEPLLFEWAYAHELPLVATNEPFFATADMAEAHEALLCIADGTMVSAVERRRMTPEHYFKSPEEMIALFEDVPEAIANTVEIARRCSFMPETRPPMLPSSVDNADETEADQLLRLSRDGLRDRLAVHQLSADEEDYWKRLEYELDIIIRMDFPGYFLIVADFMKWSRDQDIPVGPGRGSGAGSVVAWALTITDLDPLAFGLLFERFLNPERVSMPDFDIDFCQDRRDEVIHYVQDKYGHENVAQIITFGTLQARAVVRDVGRVLGMPYGQVDRICKLIPYNPANPVKLGQAIETEPELKAAVESDEGVGRLVTLALKLEGLYRHASTHAAGVVIGNQPLEQLVPLYYDPRSEMAATQFNLNWVEPAGLVKFDFLGLKTLTVLQKACTALAKRGVEIDLARLPLDDARTYEMLAKGDSIGVFQFEGAGMRDLLRQAQPSNFEDLIALVALFRPGPMENIPKYLACKHGEEKPEFLHEVVEPIVADTYGVIIYQEQVMQIAQVLSGYSLGEADLLRRAMGKKKKEEMARQKDRFVDGAVEKGVDRKQADYIFELVAKFAGYGFNKSHSAGYALVAYQTAYLKANYPVEFLAASMSLDKGNTDKLFAFCQEADARDIDVLPPDVNKSDADFSCGDGQIRYALSAIKNVGGPAMEHVVETRASTGPYSDVFDFAGRVDPQMVNRRTWENLIRAGAFDGLSGDRARLLDGVPTLLSYAAQAAEDRSSNQVSLFGDNLKTLAKPPLPKAAAWSAVEKLAEEMDAIGFYLSGHPLDDFMPALEQRRVVTIAGLRGREDRQSGIVNLAGVIQRRQDRRSQRNEKPFSYLLLSDPSGSYEVTVFSDLLAQAGEWMKVGATVVVTATAGWEDDELSLRAKGLRRLEDVVEDEASGFRLYVNRPESLGEVRDTLHMAAEGASANRKKTASVNLVLLVDNGAQEVEVSLNGRYPVNPALRGALKAISGVVDIREL